MYHLVTDDLLLTPGRIDASQGIPLGEHNAVLVHIWAQGEVSGGYYPSIELQGSEDLENWESANLSTTIASTPASVHFGAPGQILHRFVRLRFTLDSSASETVIMGASMTTVTEYHY